MVGNTQDIDEQSFHEFLNKIGKLIKSWDKLKFIPTIDDDKDSSMLIKIEDNSIREITPANKVVAIPNNGDKKENRTAVIKRSDIGFLNLSRQIKLAFKFPQYNLAELTNNEIEAYRSIPLEPTEMLDLLNFIIKDSARQKAKELLVLIRMILSRIDKTLTARDMIDEFSPIFILIEIGPIDTLHALVNLSRWYQITQRFK